MKKVWVMGVVGALAVVLNGCVAFDGEIEGKQISDDKVKIKFAVCYDGSSGSGETCEDIPDNRARGPQPSETKVLLAFRMPKGTVAPESFEPKNLNVEFTPHKRYSKQLDRKAPRKAGEKFFGYVSEPIENINSRGEFALRFGLPDKPGKVFAYRPVVGYQNGAPNNKVRCESNVTQSKSKNNTTWQCVDDPSTQEVLQKNLKIELD